MKPGGDAAKETPPLKADLSADEINTIATLPWDWDMLDSPRLKDTLKSLPEKIEGTLQKPLSKQQVQSRLDAITDSQLDQIVIQTPKYVFPNKPELSICETGWIVPFPNCWIWPGRHGLFLPANTRVRPTVISPNRPNCSKFWQWHIHI